MGNRQKKGKKGRKKSKVPEIDGAPEPREDSSAPKEEVLSILYTSEDGLLPIEVVQMAIGHNNRARVNQHGTAYKKGYFFTEIHYPIDHDDSRSKSPEELGAAICNRFDYVEDVKYGRDEFTRLEQMTRDTDEIEVQKSSDELLAETPDELIAESSGEMTAIPKVEPVVKAKKPDEPEQILVVDRNKLFGGKQKNRFQGFMSAEEAGNRFLDVIYDPKLTYFAVRDVVETDANKKQIIPYCVVYHEEFGIPKIFLMKRLPGGTEKRLHDLYSIGVGGHINPVDADASVSSRKWRIQPENRAVQSSSLWTGMRREFEEEVDCTSDRMPKIIGYINDDSNAVGKVHFGVVFLIRSGRQEIYTNEPDQLDGRLRNISSEELEGMSIEGLMEEEKKTFKFENWSEILYPHIKELLLPTKKDY
jgi:predicted NUDIX family phosphoesterase